MRRHLSAMLVTVLAISSCSGAPPSDEFVDADEQRAQIRESRSETLAWQRCSIVPALVSGSHIVDVDLGEVETIDPVAGPQGLRPVTEDRVGPPPISVTADATVTGVHHARADDPRADLFPDDMEGATLRLGGGLGTALDELGQRGVKSTSIVVGQYAPGTFVEWHVYVEFKIGQGGAIEFTGDCGAEHRRQFDEMVGALLEQADASTEVEQFAALNAAVFEPGREADLHHLARPAASRSISPLAVPPMYTDVTTFVSYVVVTSQDGEVTGTLRSDLGLNQIVTYRRDETRWERAIVRAGAAVEFAIYDEASGSSRSTGQLDAASMRGAEFVRVDLDLAEATAELSVLTASEWDELIPTYRADQVRSDAAQPPTFAAGQPTILFVG